MRIPIRCQCLEAQEYWRTEALKDPNSAESIETMQQSYRIKRMREDSNIPSRWNGRTFDAFQVNAQNREAYEVALAFEQNFDPGNGRGLMFVGTVGTGKTHLCAAVALRLLEREYSVIFGTVTSLLGQIRGTFDSDKLREREVMDKLCRCKLLVIDDLGKERATEWGAQTLYEIINTRYEDNKAILVTTNMDLLGLRKKYNLVSDSNTGDAIVDRIFECCDGVEMKWDSWRQRGL